MKRARLFFTAWLQVALVAINTWQISQSKWIGALIVGFLISWVWTGNVKKISISTPIERFIYAFGACAGTGTGLLIASHIYN